MKYLYLYYIYNYFLNFIYNLLKKIIKFFKCLNILNENMFFIR